GKAVSRYEGDGVVDVDGIRSRPAARGIARVDVHDRALAEDRGRQDGDAHEARLLVRGGDGQHGLATALEPRLAGSDEPRRALAHRDLEPPLQQPPDPTATM